MSQVKEEPRVFIGIPVHNGGDYLEQALDSVRQQNYSNWIALISDNCSTDNTREIAERYALEDNRFQVVSFDKLKSAKENFSYILARADTEYFCWLAADDFWSPLYLTKLVFALQKNAKGGLAFGPHMRCDPGGQIVGGGLRLNYGSVVGLVRFAKFLLRRESRDAVFYGVYRRRYIDSAEVWNSKEFDGARPMAYAVLARVLLASQYVFVDGDDFLFYKRGRSRSAPHIPLAPGAPYLRRKSMLREAQSLYGNRFLPLISILTGLGVGLDFSRSFRRRTWSEQIGYLTHSRENFLKRLRALPKNPD